MEAGSDRQKLTLALVAVARGEREALQQVYAATSSKLFGVCLRILRDEGEAEDVLQEVYLTVWRRAGSFDPERGVSPITWLAALARNRAIDRLRVSKAHLARPVDEIAEFADTSPLASATLEQSQSATQLNACLETLEAGHAAAIRSAFFDGQTYSDLATSAKVPLGTMKSWIRRSLQRLKTCLDA